MLSWGSHLLQSSHHFLFTLDNSCHVVILFTGIGCVGSWLTHDMLVTVRGYGTSSFSCACVPFVCLHCIFCVLLPKHLLASSLFVIFDSTLVSDSRWT